MQECSAKFKSAGKTIALVPTMGYLHQGHLSLVKKAKEISDNVIVSIFVNPTQFGPAEDLDTYPKDFKKDCNLLEEEGVDVLFAPNKKALYPDQYQTYVQVLKISKHLCGITRPALFSGVTIILTKLFNIVKPDKAIFGEKDFQQLLVIRQMVSDFNFDIEIIGSPIIREPDGLAMSSRNIYLKKAEREVALSLYKGLKKGERLVKEGEKEAKVIIKKVADFINSFNQTSIDYISICDIKTLEDIKIIDSSVLMALAVKIGKTRLIDNMLLYPKTIIG